MHRPMVGLIAVTLLCCGIALRIWPQDWDVYQALLGACWRLGLVMAALWLAHAQVSRLPASFVAAVFTIAVVVALRPRLLLLAVPLLLAAWFLRPRKQR